MVYAIYVLTDGNVIDKHETNEVIRAFANGKAEFLRWSFSGGQSDNYFPEVGAPNASCIIRFEIDNDRVTPFHTDNEIQHMFRILLHEGKFLRQVYSYNEAKQQTIDFTFHPELMEKQKQL